MVSPSVTLTRATSLVRWRQLHHLPYDNPVGRGLAPAVAYATTNLGHFVGAIHESPVYRTVKGVSVGLKPVTPIPCLQAKLD